jgi:hypothetical protein
MQISPGTLGRIAALGVGFLCLSHVTARAQELSACGEVNVQAEAVCTVVPPSAECKTMCTPVSVRAACSAKLAVDCDAQCELPSVNCDVSCQAGCTGKCTVDPGKFNCSVDCRADCSADCEASCSSNSDKTHCMASCSGACSVGCDKRCDVEPPSASCDARCKASCEGSCQVKTNLNCQIDCQADGYVKCEADVTGGCKTRCDAKEGALFCDGQFVDTGDKLQECTDALKKFLNAHVMASSSGDSSCENGTCMAEGKAAVSSDCTVANVGSASKARAGLFGILSLLGIGLVLRRRRAS